MGGNISGGILRLGGKKPRGEGNMEDFLVSRGLKRGVEMGRVTFSGRQCYRKKGLEGGGLHFFGKGELRGGIKKKGDFMVQKSRNGTAE